MASGTMQIEIVMGLSMTKMHFQMTERNGKILIKTVWATMEMRILPIKSVSMRRCLAEPQNLLQCPNGRRQATRKKRTGCTLHRDIVNTHVEEQQSLVIGSSMMIKRLPL